MSEVIEKPIEETPPVAPAVEEKPLESAPKEVAPEVKTPEPIKEASPTKVELKLQEGSKVSEATLKEIEALATAKGLSQEAAQTLLERENEILVKQETHQAEFIKAKRNEWLEASKSDVELGGEHFAANAEYATQAAERWGGQPFQTLLNETGFGNHPVVFKFLSGIGKAMQSDSFSKGTAASHSKKSVAEVFYPSQKKE